jgi:hypothetical protein
LKSICARQGTRETHLLFDCTDTNRKNRPGNPGRFSSFKKIECDFALFSVQSGLGGDAEVLLNGGENLVAACAGFFDVAGFQGESQAFRRGVGLVNRDVAPPDPPVVPQVMVGVVIINSKSDFGLGFHLCDLFQ